MTNNIWHLENFDFYQILCPYKYERHIQSNPLHCYKKNDFLFFENEAAKEIILIDKGKVKIGSYDNEGNERVVAILGRGEILGQMALLGEKKHRLFAVVIEDGTQVCKMGVEKAKELTRDYIPFALEINRRISGHIYRLERRIELLLFKDVKTRLIEFLKDLATELGRQRDGGIWISHTLTQSDIASLIGTSRKSASLLMNELENEGILQFDRKHIFIPDMGRLKESRKKKTEELY